MEYINWAGEFNPNYDPEPLDAFKNNCVSVKKLFLAVGIKGVFFLHC
jgi:hypothetical protein